MALPMLLIWMLGLAGLFAVWGPPGWRMPELIAAGGWHRVAAPRPTPDADDQQPETDRAPSGGRGFRDALPWLLTVATAIPIGLLLGAALP